MKYTAFAGSRPRILLPVICLVFVLMFVAPSSAQVTGGSIEGAITDKSGAVIPQAQITIRNEDTNVVQTTTTNSEGVFNVPNLLPGKYDISAKSAGFSTAIVDDIVLTVGVKQVVNLTLNPGAVEEHVDIDSAAPLVELSSSTMSGVVDSQTVKELPLNARDWTQLATLQPGVSAIRTQVVLSSGPDRGNRGFGSQLTISGGRPSQNNYRLDGVSINDYSNGAPGSVLGVNLGVDAVEEFSVLTSNYSAEYGRTSGGVINAITRSGSNTFHGDAYEFIRNSALDAKNYFDPPKKPPFKRNQFGASAGGPLIKNRTFIFGDYEGVRQSTSLSTPITVPSASARAGAPPGSVAATYLGFFPAPPNTSGDQASVISVIPQITSENYFTVRADHSVSSANKLAGTYVFDDAKTTQPDPLSVVLTGNSTKRQIATLEDTHIFSSSFVNTARFGFNRVAAFAGQNANAINPLATDTSLGVVPGRPAPGIVFSDGIITFPGGLGASPNYRFHWNTFQFYDDAFPTKGIQSIKFGFAVERILDNILASSDANGVVIYKTFSDFLSNAAPSGFNAAIPQSITERQVRQTIYAGYVQDDIRLRSNFTANAGLRYEISTVPTETHGRLSTLRNVTDAQPHLGSPFFSNPTYRNFEPRIGFSWDPFKNGKTAVRGGMGIFDVLPLPYLYELLLPLASPYYQLGSTSTFPNPNPFPGGLFPLIGNASNLRQSYVQPNPKRNYVLQWNLNVQREIAPDLTAMIAYVGSRGIHHAFRADDINSVIPLDPGSRTPTFPVCKDSGGNQVFCPFLNPNVGQISTVVWSGDSYYHALQSQLTKRMKNGLQAQASYTWGKSIDTGSATVGGDSFGNSISSLPYYNSRLRRGPSDFNVTHNLVMNFTWLLPTPKDGSALVDWVAGGWQLGGVYQLSSGIPFTPNLGGDPLFEGGTDPWDFPDRSTAPGCRSLVRPSSPLFYVKIDCLIAPSSPNRRGNLGRNSVTGPRLQNLDFSFVKNSHIHIISEAINLQFRIEMFNIANHASFSPPVNHQTILNFDGTSIQPVTAPNQKNGQYIVGAGSIDTTSTTSRQIQFGLKVIW